jgi:hypothetical protein
MILSGLRLNFLVNSSKITLHFLGSWKPFSNFHSKVEGFSSVPYKISLFFISRSNKKISTSSSGINLSSFYKVSLETE